MAAQSPPFALQNGSHSAALFRQAVASVLNSRGGLVASADMFVTAQSTPNMSVQVAAGRGWMPGTQVSNVSGGAWNTQAAYYGINDAPTTVTIAAANAVNPRIDLIYAAVNDQAYSGSTNNMVIGVVTGTPAASPAVPAAPNNSLSVAQVTVSANATSIVSGNILNVGQRAAGLGGIMPVGSQLERDLGIPGVTRGFAVYRLDTGHIEAYNGTTWDTVFPGATLPAYNVGGGSVTTNASGDFTITHGLGTGVAPTTVLVTDRTIGSLGGHVIAVSGKSATTFTCRAYYNNAADPSATFSVYWRVDA